jgi:hypothetical protein
LEISDRIFACNKLYARNGFFGSLANVHTCSSSIISPSRPPQWAPPPPPPPPPPPLTLSEIGRNLASTIDPVVTVPSNSHVVLNLAPVGIGPRDQKPASGGRVPRRHSLLRPQADSGGGRQSASGIRAVRRQAACGPGPAFRSAGHGLTYRLAMRPRTNRRPRHDDDHLHDPSPRPVRARHVSSSRSDRRPVGPAATVLLSHGPPLAGTRSSCNPQAPAARRMPTGDSDTVTRCPAQAHGPAWQRRGATR